MYINIIDIDILMFHKQRCKALLKGNIFWKINNCRQFLISEFIEAARFEY